LRLQGKIALVTGAASGFGAGIARRFAAEGAQVALLDINGEGAREVAAGAGGGAIGLTCDVTKGADVDQALQASVRLCRRPSERSGGSTS
jgi:3-oxoacyl-[acyl-carrier protein] reductase